jgi:PEP-CTERM motif
MRLRNLLLTTAALLAMTTASQAAIVGSFGADPTSAAGVFSNDPNGPGVGGLFSDFYTFTLTTGSWVTVANATNTFATGGLTGTFGIQNFAAAIFQTVGVPGGGDDILRFGPQFATLNPGGLSQSLNGIGLLNAGDYYLQVAGTAGALAGYGGNFAVAAVGAVPEPATWTMMLAGLTGIGLFGLRKRRQAASFRLV